MAETFSIQDLGREFGITARTLRHYEEEGLLYPARNGQTRVYSRADRARLAWILRGKRMGFTLHDIREVLDLYSLSDGRETQRKVTINKCRERIKDLEDQRNDIDATINELTAFKDRLSGIKWDRETGCWVDQRTGKPHTYTSPIDHINENRKTR